MAKLKVILQKHGGRDSSGQVAVRHQGGRHKRFYRMIDFKRNNAGVAGKVAAIEYDPNRSVDVALVNFVDGDKRYILVPVGLKVGDTVMAGEKVEIKAGNALPMMNMPVGSIIHNIELTRGKGGQIVRSAGNQAIIQSREGAYVQVKLPSGEVRKINGVNYATIGQLGNVHAKDRVFGKAGAKRRMGIRPTVRGVAMSPKSHPHGGGEG
ncbi:MAG TPA: 50S ribosomal protein L2, partial [Candidatus Levybacteria bacterium]|nr:50S ribosomal protein L2 [Candidatus Levybacteria bacterium]